MGVSIANPLNFLQYINVLVRGVTIRNKFVTTGKCNLQQCRKIEIAEVLLRANPMNLIGAQLGEDVGVPPILATNFGQFGFQKFDKLLNNLTLEK
ncbi:hypothetical protein BRX36_14565 [Sphingomonas sp. S-NIH.Pt1_0416]|nr:hypothetical protein BRX36_14565 [Sphingomonas sp. S-NIH.Pt1_0416]